LRGEQRRSGNRARAGRGRCAGGSGWSPLRYTEFRRWWLANLTSNVGSWMQTVAAQWLMISLTSSALLVGAIQATNLPVLLLAVPAGVLGDLLDRKRLILFGQLIMLLAAAGLGALAIAHAVTPATLLLLLCGLGVGQGLTAPTLQPELVPAEERAQAIALGSVNQNLARAIGPPIGGLLLAATSAELVFFVNALSFVAVLAVFAAVAVPKRSSALPREHLRSAARAGARFVMNAPALTVWCFRGGLVLIGRRLAGGSRPTARQVLGDEDADRERTSADPAARRRPSAAIRP
jgi:MFS family permease